MKREGECRGFGGTKKIHVQHARDGLPQVEPDDGDDGDDGDGDGDDDNDDAADADDDDDE